MDARFCDEGSLGFGWIADERMQRTSHALLDDGGVWLVDPVAWEPALERAASLGELRGVIQLLDRHARDCAASASRFHVPHHVVPREAIGPFAFLRVQSNRFWKEVALWWADERILVCADAVGTIPYFVAAGDRLGVHPLLRLVPPRRLRGLDPQHIVVGHGAGVHDRAAEALEEALSTARRRAPSALARAVRAALPARRSGVH
jgi:hypothetical protein